MTMIHLDINMIKVYSFGVYDLIHFGHMRALKQAKALGDYLIVGVFTDRVAEGFKRKPILTFGERYMNIVELDIADEVVILDEFMPNPDVDIVAKAEGAGWSKDHIPSYFTAKTILLNYTEGISTSDIIKRILNTDNNKGAKYECVCGATFNLVSSAYCLVHPCIDGEYRPCQDKKSNKNN